jgi:N-formylglutamate amidohydrolase
MRCLRSIVAFAVVTLLAVHAAPAPAPGQATFTANRYVESVSGDLPIVLTAPHGGALKPDSIANRKEGVLGADLNSLELARALAAELFARTGRHPALVASHLHRSKLDPNREIKEAAQGDPTAESAWRDFHAVARHGFAFLIDLHGHSHPIARLELGYALDSAQLNRPDATFDASGLITLSTLRDLHARSGPALAPSALIRGPRSLGALYQAAGLRAIPSPQEPQPGANPFFAGGYIVRTYAAAPDTPKVDGLQIETYRIGVRDTSENRARFARLTVDVLTPFLREHYAFDLAAKK